MFNIIKDESQTFIAWLNHFQPIFTSGQPNPDLGFTTREAAMTTMSHCKECLPQSSFRVEKS